MNSSRTLLVVLVAASALLFVGCGSSGSGGSGTTSAKTGDKSGSSSGSAEEYSLHKVMDGDGTGKPAGSYLIPTGWTANDKVTWITNNFLTPVILHCTIDSSDGITQLDELSAFSVTFSHSPGSSAGTNPPSDLSKFLISGWKQSHKGVSYAVVSAEDTPLDKSFFAANNAPISYAKTATVKLRYKADGKPILVKLYARLDVQSTGEMQTGMGTMAEGNWLISSAWTATAPEAEFPDAMKKFGVVLTSWKEDPHFFNTVVQCQQIIQQNFNNNMREIQETSRIISQTNDAISDTIMKGYENQQAAQDHEAQNFDDYIRGVQRYKDDDGQVALPNDYNHAWSDGSGNYLMTNDSGYDPNSAGVSGSWHAMDQAP